MTADSRCSNSHASKQSLITTVSSCESIGKNKYHLEEFLVFGSSSRYHMRTTQLQRQGLAWISSKSNMHYYCYRCHAHGCDSNAPTTAEDAYVMRWCISYQQLRSRHDCILMKIEKRVTHRRSEKERSVLKHHNRSLCTQKQLEIHR